MHNIAFSSHHHKIHYNLDNPVEETFEVGTATSPRTIAGIPENVIVTFFDDRFVSVEVKVRKHKADGTPFQRLHSATWYDLDTAPDWVQTLVKQITLGQSTY